MIVEKTFRVYFNPQKVTREEILGAVKYYESFVKVESWAIDGENFLVANFVSDIPQVVRNIPGAQFFETYSKEVFEDDGNYKSFRREGLEGTEPC